MPGPGTGYLQRHGVLRLVPRPGATVEPGALAGTYVPLVVPAIVPELWRFVMGSPPGDRGQTLVWPPTSVGGRSWMEKMPTSS